MINRTQGNHNLQIHTETASPSYHHHQMNVSLKKVFDETINFLHTLPLITITILIIILTLMSDDQEAWIGEGRAEECPPYWDT